MRVWGGGGAGVCPSAHVGQRQEHTLVSSVEHTHRSLRPTPSGNLEHPNVANQANVHLFGHVGGILRITGNPTGPETRTFWDPQWWKLALLPSLYLDK